MTSQALRKDCAGVILYCAEKATWMAVESIQALGKKTPPPPFYLFTLLFFQEVTATSMIIQLDVFCVMPNFMKLVLAQVKSED